MNVSAFAQEPPAQVVVGANAAVVWDYDDLRATGFRIYQADGELLYDIEDASARQVPISALSLSDGMHSIYMTAYSGSLESAPSETFVFTYDTSTLPAPRVRILVTVELL